MAQSNLKGFSRLLLPRATILHWDGSENSQMDESSRGLRLEEVREVCDCTRPPENQAPFKGESGAERGVACKRA